MYLKLHLNITTLTGQLSGLISKLNFLEESSTIVLILILLDWWRIDNVTEEEYVGSEYLEYGSPIIQARKTW